MVITCECPSPPQVKQKASKKAKVVDQMDSYRGELEMRKLGHCLQLFSHQQIWWTELDIRIAVISFIWTYWRCIALIACFTECLSRSKCLRCLDQ